MSIKYIVISNILVSITIKQLLKLSLLFFFLLFLAGRIGLLLHEFGGHALSWRMLGGGITDYTLFLFGGGRVHGWAPATAGASALSALFVQLSGIAVELAVGIPLALLALFRGTHPFIKTLFAATSGVLIVHSLFYLVICAYYGSGDGALLFTLLQGSVRKFFLVLAFSLTILGAFLVSYAFSPATRNWVISHSRKQRSALIISGVLGAVLLHGVLTVGERVILKDRTYAELKMPVNIRLMHEESAEFIATYTRAHGREPSKEQIAAFRMALEEKYRQFPMEIPLGMAVLAAFAAGFFLSMRRDDDCNPAGWKDVGLSGALSVSVAVFILILNRL